MCNSIARHPRRTQPHRATSVVAAAAAGRRRRRLPVARRAWCKYPRASCWAERTRNLCCCWYSCAGRAPRSARPWRPATWRSRPRSLEWWIIDPPLSRFFVINSSSSSSFRWLESRVIHVRALWMFLCDAMGIWDTRKHFTVREKQYRIHYTRLSRDFICFIIFLFLAMIHDFFLLV